MAAPTYAPAPACSSCGTAPVMTYEASPVMAPAPTAPATSSAPALEPSAPVDGPAEAEGSVIVPSEEGAMRRPMVDPNAFVIRRN